MLHLHVASQDRGPIEGDQAGREDTRAELGIGNSSREDLHASPDLSP